MRGRGRGRQQKNGKCLGYLPSEHRKQEDEKSRKHVKMSKIPHMLLISTSVNSAEEESKRAYGCSGV